MPANCKKCPKCGETKPRSAEFFVRNGADGLHSWCRPCYSEWRRAWTRNNREREAASQKRYRERHPDYFKHKSVERKLRQFGITKEQYARMLELQAGACAICGLGPHGKRLAVDHDHASGTVRGLLCGRCNGAIGLLGDCPGTLASAVLYLLGGARMAALRKVGIDPLQAWFEGNPNADPRPFDPYHSAR